MSGNPLKDYLAAHLAGVAPQPSAPMAMGPVANPGDRARFIMAAAVERAKHRRLQEQQAPVQQRAAPVPNVRDQSHMAMAAAVARAKARRDAGQPDAQPQPDPRALAGLVTASASQAGQLGQGYTPASSPSPQQTAAPNAQQAAALAALLAATTDQSGQLGQGYTPATPPPSPYANVGLSTAMPVTGAAPDQHGVDAVLALMQAKRIEANKQAAADADIGDPLVSAAEDYGQGVGTAAKQAGTQAVSSALTYGADPSVATARQQVTPLAASGIGLVGAVANLPGINKPQEWASEKLGDLAYIAASGGEMPDWVNSIPEGPKIWERITAGVQDQKQEIVAAHDTGGGRAVYDDVFTNTEGLGFWSSLAIEMSAAALTDPLTYAGLASMSSENIIRILDQKVASGLELTTAEKGLYTAAKGAHVATTVPNAVADAPFTAAGKALEGVAGGIKWGTRGRIDPAAAVQPTAENVLRDSMTQIDEADQAITAARLMGDLPPAAAAPNPTAADEARLIQNGAHLPQQPTVQPPTTGATQSTVAGATPRTKGTGQYERAKMDGGHSPRIVILDPDGEWIETATTEGIKDHDGTVVRPIPKGGTVGVEVAKRIKELNDDLLGTHEAGIDLPGTEPEVTATPTESGNGATFRVPTRKAVLDPEGPEVMPDGRRFRWATAEEQKPDTITRSNVSDSAPPAADHLTGHWIDPKTGRKDWNRVDQAPSTVEWVENEVRPAAPELADDFKDAYNADPRLPEFKQKMAEFEASPEKQALREMGITGKGLDSPEQVLEQVKHTVEVQRPHARERVGVEPPPYRFDYGDDLDTAIPVRDKSGKGRQKPDERVVVERAVFGTNDEAKRARQALHLEIGDLAGKIKQATTIDEKAALTRRQLRYQHLLDETSRLRQMEVDAGGLVEDKKRTISPGQPEGAAATTPPETPRVVPAIIQREWENFGKHNPATKQGYAIWNAISDMRGGGLSDALSHDTSVNRSLRNFAGNGLNPIPESAAGLPVSVETRADNRFGHTMSGGVPFGEEGDYKTLWVTVGDAELEVLPAAQGRQYIIHTATGTETMPAGTLFPDAMARLDEIASAAPKGANPGRGPNLAGTVLDAIDALPGPKPRPDTFVPSTSVPISEADRMFEAARISAEHRDILNRVINVGFGDNRTPMTVADLFNENAATLGEAEGKKLSLKQITAIERERLGMRPGEATKLAKAYDGFKAASAITRGGIQFNVVTGLRGIIGDMADLFTLAITGHGRAVPDSFNKQLIAETIRAIGSDMDPAMLNLLDVAAPLRESGEQFPMDVLPRSHSGAGANRADVSYRGETDLHRLILKGTGGKFKGITGPLSGVFYNKLYRDLRAAFDSTKRMALFLDQYQTNLGEARAVFEGKLRERATFVPGANADQWLSDILDTARARVEAEGGAWQGTFSPEDVRIATGQTELSQRWKHATVNAKKAAKAETDRVLFSYKQNNIDKALSDVVFFHYWQSRALALHTRTAIKNPWLLAAYWRTWQALGDQAEKDGYPDSLKGYIRFMGESTHGWFGLFNPLGIIVPFTMFSEMGGEKDKAWWQQFKPFINPWVEGAAAAFGFGDNVPDVSGTWSVRNMTRAVLDWGNAHGVDFLPGGDHPSGDFVRNIEAKVYDLANRGLRSLHVPIKAFGPYDPQSSQYVNLRDRVEQIATDQWGPRQGWTPEQTQAVTDAKIKVEPGVSDDDTSESGNLARTAWKDYTDAQLGNRLASAMIPGGTRQVNADLTRRRQQAGAFYDTLDTGATATPEQDAAADAMQSTNAGSPEAMALGTQQNAYNEIGTERERSLAAGWNQLAHDEVLPPGTITIGGRTWYSDQFAAMSEEERILWANKWVQENDGTAELRSYREKRDAYVASHPEYQGYDTYQQSARGKTPTDTRAFRTRAVEDHPEFADELDQQRKKFEGEGKKGEVLEKELDEWTVSAAGYNAFRGVRQSIYDDAPKDAYNPSKDAFGGSWGAAAGTSDGGGGGSGAPYSKVASLKKQLATYQAKVTMASDLLGMDVTKMNPYSRQAYDNLGVLPKPSSDLLLYMEWASSQPAGADNTVEAYVAYLDELEASGGAGYVSPSNGVTTTAAPFSLPMKGGSAPTPMTIGG